MSGTLRGAGYISPERGVCRVCGTERPLRYTDGYIKRHRGRDGEPCPGGAQPPARPSDEVTAELPN